MGIVNSGTRGGFFGAAPKLVMVATNYAKFILSNFLSLPNWRGDTEKLARIIYILMSPLQPSLGYENKSNPFKYLKLCPVSLSSEYILDHNSVSI